jgi:hypothetical protein
MITSSGATAFSIAESMLHGSSCVQGVVSISPGAAYRCAPSAGAAPISPAPATMASASIHAPRLRQRPCNPRGFAPSSLTMNER